MSCPYCHPHCVRCDESSDCVTCECRKTRPLKRRSVKITLGERYMLRQGRESGGRRVSAGEIVRVTHMNGGGSYTCVAHDGTAVYDVQPNELGRNK